MLTPYLAVDLVNLEKNICTMAKISEQLGVRVRPHFKTHKSTVIAKKQIDQGAIGITCATLGEAEVVVNSGIKDILISREISGGGKLQRLAKLCPLADIKVVVDHPRHVVELAEAMREHRTHVGVVLEINVGQNRCGLDPEDEGSILTLLELIEQNPGLNFRGLQGYEGHLVLLTDEKERTLKTQEANEKLTSVVQLAQKAGYSPEIVTGGGTGTALISGKCPGMTEIQPGSYATMDRTYSAIMGDLFLPAVKVVTTVVSKPACDRLIIDAGSKAVSTDYGPPEIVGQAGYVYQAGGDEYGIIRRFDGGQIEAEVGDEISLYPAHGCTTFNLYDNAYGLNKGQPAVELALEGRGKSY